MAAEAGLDDVVAALLIAGADPNSVHMVGYQKYVKDKFKNPVQVTVPQLTLDLQSTDMWTLYRLRVDYWSTNKDRQLSIIENPLIHY